MNDKLTLQELIDLLAVRHQMESQDADAFVKEFWTLIEEGLRSDNYVKIKGLGTFKLIDTEARESINIQTGERIEIQSHARVTFSPEASLRDLINRPFAHFETVVLNDATKVEEFDEVDAKAAENEAVVQQVAIEEEESATEEPSVEEGQSVDAQRVFVESQPIEEEQPAEDILQEVPAKDPAGVVIEEEMPIEEEKPIEEEVPTEEEVPDEVEVPAEEEVPDEVEVPAEEEVPEEAEVPAEEEVPEEVEVPAEEQVSAEEQTPEKVVASNEEVAVQKEESEETAEGTPVVTVEKAAEKPIDRSSEELIAIAAEAVKQHNIEHDSFCRKSKRRLSWCIIACSTLLGVVIGGFSTIFLVGTKYDKLISTRTVESMVTSLLDKKEIAADSLKLSVDSLAKESVPGELNSEETVDIPAVKLVEELGESSAMQPAAKTVKQAKATNSANSVSQTAVKAVEKPAKHAAKPKEKPVYLSEKIEYKIAGTIATHTLRNGETLTRVALKYYGNKKIWPYLVMHNKEVIKNPDNVPIGTTIRVPKLLPVSPTN